jgi:hypothetical protein
MGKFGFRRAFLTVAIFVVFPLGPALASSAEAAPQSQSGESSGAEPAAEPGDPSAANSASSAAGAGVPAAEPGAGAPTGGEPPTAAPAEQGLAAERTELNLLGQTDTASGESRRNENVKFNPIDNNALREVNVRIGTTATLVEEFEPQRKYFSAEFGTRPEAPIHAGSSPAAAIHGTLYEIHNNSVFAARSFFQVGGVQPARENNYGFTFGAPLWGGANFTLDGSQQRVRGNVNGNVLVPNADERTPLTGDPAILPIVEGFLGAYPNELPNRPDITDRALNTNSPQRINTDHIGGTLDQGLGGKDRLILRYGLTSQTVKAFQLVAGQNPDSDLRAHSARITWNRVWSSNTVTDFSTGFDRVGTVLRQEENAVGPAVSLFIIQRLGSPSVPVDRAVNEFRHAGQLSHARGKHFVTAGFAVLRRQFNGREANNHLGTFRFGDNFGRDAVTNLRMGTATRYTVTVGDTGRGFRNWEGAFYAGDRWQATPNLTLTFGLRYEPNTRPVEVNGLDVVPYDCDCNNLAPSFGFANRLPGRWGVLRGAYGLHYGQIFPATYGQVRFNPPGNIGINVDGPYLADPLAGFDLTSLPPNTRSSLTVISPELATPYSHQYNFGWEPDFWRNVRLQLGYVGSRSHKLFASWTTNRADPIDGIPQNSATVNQRRPDANFFGIDQVLNGSRAFYDAARVSVIVPQWRGWSLEASYWFSKSIDLGGDYSTTGASGGAPPQADSLIHDDTRSVSSFHQPHALLARGSYELPALIDQPPWVRQVFGSWEVSGALLMKTGTPFPAFAGSDAPGFGNVDGENGDRVHIIDPSILGNTVGHPDTSVLQMPSEAFAFMAPTDPRGNIGRNTFRKGKIANVNAAISRSWRISAEKALTFRVESINLLNTPQFADPERNLSSKAFGRISNTLNDGRAFQFLLRFAF